MTDSRPAKTRKPISRQFTLLSWVFVLLWACVIFFMSSRTDSGLNEGMNIISVVYQWLKAQQLALLGEGVDVLMPLAHFCEYAIFGALLINALRLHMPPGRAFVFAILLASAYGVTDEFHQYFVPGRMCDPLDWIVDTLGACLGSGLVFLHLRNRENA